MMNESKTASILKNGFTLVELIMVIAVIGLLATMSVMGYGNWRKSVATAQVRSDLNGVVSAMENARTYNNLYPLTIPNTMTASNGVTLSGGGSADGKSYCVDGASVTNPTVVYYVDSWSSGQGAQQGTCATRPTLPAVPSGLAVVSTTTSQINLSWTAVASATGYTAQCAPDTTYTVGMQQSTQTTTTGSVIGLNSGSLYYCHVRATNTVGNSAWSADVTATTAFSWIWTMRTGASEPVSTSWYGVASSADGTKLVASAFSGLNGNPSLDWNDLWTSTNSGVTWTRRDVSGVQSWGSIASSSDGTKLVATATMSSTTTALWTSTNSGVTWTQRTATTTKSWVDVASSSDGTKLVAVNQTGSSTGTLWTSTDSGITWIQRAAAGNNWWGVASSADGTKLVAVDFGGYVYTSTDSGITWIQRPAAGSRGWRGVASSADGTKLVAVPKKNIYGANVPDYIFTSTDSGVTWTQRTSAGAREWFGAASSADGTKLVASSYGPYLFTSADSGATWTEHTATGAHQAWYRVASSADGNKVIGAPYADYLWTGVFGP